MKKSIILAGLSVLAAGIAAAALAGCSGYKFEKYSYNFGGTSENDWRALEYPDEEMKMDGLVDEDAYGDTYLSFSDVNNVNMKLYAHMGEEGVFFGFVSNDKYVNYNPSHDVFENTSVEIQVAPFGTEKLNANVVQLRLGANGTPDQWVGFPSEDGYQYSKKYIPSIGAVHVNGTINEGADGYSVELYLPYTSIGLEEKPEDGVICAPSFNTMADPNSATRGTWTMMLGCELTNPATWYVVDGTGMTTHTAGFKAGATHTQEEKDRQFSYVGYDMEEAYLLKTQVTLDAGAANSFLGDDMYPKFGIVNRGNRALRTFHIDAAERKGVNFGTVLASQTTDGGTSWQWDSNASTSMGDHWGSVVIDGGSEVSRYKNIDMESILYEGNLYFILDGTLVGTAHNFTEKGEGAVPGFFTFNTMAKFRSVEYKKDKEEVEKELSSFLPKEKTIDGDLSDWTDEEINRHFKAVEDTNGNKMKVRAFRGEDGLYIAYEVHHLLVAPVAKWDGSWWRNTNIEFFIGGKDERNHYALTTFGTSGYMDAVMTTTRDENREYDTVGEIFVPFDSLARDGFELTSDLEVGFAFKPAENSEAGNLLKGSNWWRLTDGEPNTNYLRVAAKGIGEEYTLTYTAGEGTGEDEEVSVFGGDVITLQAPSSFTKEGYRFLNWSDGTRRYAVGEEYTMPEEDTTLTAMWISNTASGAYGVTYQKGEGDVTGDVPVDNNEYAPGDRFDVATKGNLAREGYRFMGWTDGETTYEAGGKGNIEEKNVVLTAIWSKEYTLEYDLGSVTGDAPEGGIFVEGERFTLSKDVPEDENYDFFGWTFEDKTYTTDETFVMPNKNVTLTAVWKPKIKVDGSTADWTQLDSKVLSAHSYTDERGATWYGVLRDDGVYLAVEYTHNNDPKFGQEGWFNNTNFEIRFKDSDAANHFYVYLKDATMLATLGSDGQYDFGTSKAVFQNTGSVQKKSVFEVFYPNSIVEKYKAGSAIRVGLAVKTAGGDESINGGGVGFEGDAWYAPYGVWPDDPSMYAYITREGLYLSEEYEHPDWEFGSESAVSDDHSISADGNLSDWTEDHTIGITGTDLYNGKSVTFHGKLTSKGLYLAAEAYHEIFTTGQGNWWNNTNFELRIGRNWGGDGNKRPRQFWVNATASGCAVSAEGMQAKLFTESVTDKGTAKVHTIIEVFIPNSVFLEYDYMIKNGSIQVGVAWKTNDDRINNGTIGDDPWWMPLGEQVNTNPAVVDGTGIYTAAEYAAKQA